MVSSNLAETLNPSVFGPLIFEQLGIERNALTVTIFVSILAAMFLGVISLIAMFCIWWERKVAGHMQSRIGPNRVGPYGLLQSLADGIKLIAKEDLCPKDADKVLFRLAQSREQHCPSLELLAPLSMQLGVGDSLH